MGQRQKWAAGFGKFLRSELCPEPSPLNPKVKKPSTDINLLCGDPQAGVRCSPGQRPGMPPGSRWPALDRAPDSPRPGSRQEVWKQTRENRIRIREHVYEEGEKMCVNCMMKCKPLVLNEKSESGPKPAEGLGIPGVCGERLGKRGGQGETQATADLSPGGLIAIPGRERGLPPL